MKNIIKRTELAVNPHIVKNGNVAYAIFTGYNEYYQAMISGSISGRVVRIERDDLDNYTDEDLLDMGKCAGIDFDTDSKTKIIRKGWNVR